MVEKGVKVLKTTIAVEKGTKIKERKGKKFVYARVENRHIKKEYTI